MSDCVFCDIVNGRGKSTIVKDWPGALAIVPKNPVTFGHTLVIPRVHADNAAVDPQLTGLVAGYAAELAASWAVTKDFNLIVNCGAAASMTVPHLHWHIVPRREGDGLSLPWTGQTVGGDQS
jgi:histidine triad (HIT) family protein